MALSDRKKLEYCKGCRENYYNSNNPHGIKCCWSFEKAKVVWRKLVHLDDRPPWNHKAQRVLNCYKKPRYVSIDPKVVR